jgi:putative copper resistance protein D
MTPSDVVTQATFSPVPLALILVLGGWYLASLRRLAGRGEAWPAVRTASFCLAELSLAFGLLSGIAAYDRIFRVVAVQHILLSIAAPIFLAVSAPITLALEAGSPRTRAAIERALHSRASKVLSHPKFTWTFYGLSLYVLYFTHLYVYALQHDAIHTLVHLGLLLAGCLFWWPAVGVDPIPYRPGQGTRIFYMLLVLPLYTILGMGLESQTSPLAPGMSLVDMHAGAGVMWVAGEITGLLGTLVLFVLWLRADERAAQQHDGASQASAATQLAHWRATRDAAARAYKG